MKDIQPTTTQMKRILAEPLGGGILLYHLADYTIAGDATRDYSEDNPCEIRGSVHVIQFQVNMETGEVTTADGSPLIFWTDKSQSVGHKLVKVTGQAEMFL